MHLKPTTKHKRQLWLLVKKFKQTQNKNLKTKLWNKITSLYTELSDRLRTRQFKNLLGASCFVLSSLLSSNLQAQSPFFNQVQVDPFGLEQGVSKSIYWRNPMQGDLDGDGDIDILNFQFNLNVALDSYSCDAVFYQNNGNVEDPKFVVSSETIPGLDQLTEEYAFIGELADLDGDGDLDILATTYNLSTYEIKNSFVENVGTPQAPVFDSIIQHNVFGIFDPSLNFGFISAIEDIDNDGDLDIISGSYSVDPRIKVAENIGTIDDPEFNYPQSLGLEQNEQLYVDVSLKDLDGDGDLDILSTNYVGYEYSADVMYFENKGTQEEASFDEGVAVSDFTVENEGFLFHELIDMDTDGDLDLILFDYDGRAFYCENSALSNSIEISKGFSLKIVPNPTSDFIQLQGDFNAESIRLIDVLGKSVQQWNGMDRLLSIRDLPSGNYILQILNRDQILANHTIQKL